MTGAAISHFVSAGDGMFGFGRDMLMSGVSAAAVKTTVAPIERVKLLLQLQNTSTQISAETRYKGIIDCFRRIPQEQGFLSLWRGNLTNVYRYFFVQAFNFAFKDAYKKYLSPPAKNGQKASFAQLLAGNLASGAAAGLTSIVITYPLDFARTRLATDVGRGGTRQFHGLIHCIRTVVAREGVRGVYFGLPLSIPTVIMYRATYFGVYDTSKLFVPGGSILWKWGCAQFSTTIAGLLCYPIDTVRRRLVMQSGRTTEERHYFGVRDCVRKIYQTEGGMRGFYKGSLSNILRGTGGALVLVMYDELKQDTS